MYNITDIKIYSFSFFDLCSAIFVSINVNSEHWTRVGPKMRNMGFNQFF